MENFCVPLHRYEASIRVFSSRTTTHHITFTLYFNMQGLTSTIYTRTLLPTIIHFGWMNHFGRVSSFSKYPWIYELALSSIWQDVTPLTY